VAKKTKKQEMPILWESFLIFMFFIFYKQGRYGRGKGRRHRRTGQEESRGSPFSGGGCRRGW